MGILDRFTSIIKANVNDLLDKAEDPAKMVDQYLRDLTESLAEVKAVQYRGYLRQVGADLYHGSGHGHHQPHYRYQNAYYTPFGHGFTSLRAKFLIR